MFKHSERQVSEMNLVIKAKLAKVQFCQWRELAISIGECHSPAVEGDREAVALPSSSSMMKLLGKILPGG